MIQYKVDNMTRHYIVLQLWTWTSEDTLNLRTKITVACPSFAIAKSKYCKNTWVVRRNVRLLYHMMPFYCMSLQPTPTAAHATPFPFLHRHHDPTLEPMDWFTLTRKSKAELIQLCTERNLPHEDVSKERLIQQLMQYKINTIPIMLRSDPVLAVVENREDESVTADTLVDMSLATMHPTQDVLVPALPPPQENLVVDPKRGVDSAQMSAMVRDPSDDTLETIPWSSLTYGKKLGSGGFKDVYAGTWNNDPIAIGEVRITHFTQEDYAEIKHEIQVLKQLHHENVVRFYGIVADSQHLCLITELCEHGDLYDFMRKSPKPPFAQLVSYMYDIAFGVHYLHGRRPSIIHRDMKSMNVLVSKDFRAKINDFGLARIRPRATTMHTAVGTPNWQAPEFWSPNPSYTEKVDVYACGLIFWEILQWGALPYPFHDLTEHQLYIEVRDHGRRPPMDNLIKARYPSSLLNLIRAMWDGQPHNRPSMGIVLEHLAEFLS